MKERASKSPYFSDDDLSTLRHRATADAVARLHGIELQREGQVLRALCPLHRERTPSFTIFPDGRARCFGCGWYGDGMDLHQKLTGTDFVTTVRNLSTQLGLGLARSMPTEDRPPSAALPDLPLTPLEGAPKPHSNAWPLSAARECYAYTDAEGALVCYEARVVRGRGASRRKQSVPCRPSPYGLIRGIKAGVYFRDRHSSAGQPSWIPWRGARTPSGAALKHFPGVTVPLFNLTAIAADPWNVIFFTEGPKDATTVSELGLLGTTLMFGAGAAARADPTVLKPLEGRDVALLRDGDEAGERGVQATAKVLHNRGARVRLLPAFRPPPGEEMPPGGKFDVSDWVAAERRAERSDSDLTLTLLERYRAARPYEPPSNGSRGGGIGKNGKGRNGKKKGGDGIGGNGKGSNGKGSNGNNGNTPSGSPPGEDDDGRHLVYLSSNEGAVNDAVLEAMAIRADNLYQRSGALVEVLPAVLDGPLPRGPIAAPVQAPRLRELTTAHVRFRRAISPKKTIAAHPPEWCVKALSARSDWPGMRPLAGIVEGPVIRRDGSVLEQPGYDPATGLLYAPRGGMNFDPVPEAPTARQVEEALITVLETVCDFPFEEEAHQAAWLAALLTVVARPAIDCTVPLFLADATTPGSGKGKILHTIALIVTGYPAPLTEWPADPDEQRKTVSTFLVEGTQIVIFDNVVNTLGGSTLDMLLTSERVTGRVLGSSRSFNLPNNATWMATANNCDLGGDTARRTIQIRLRPDVERPELRNDFRYRDLRGWIVQNRRRLLPATLTLLRAYWLERRPHERTLEDLLAEEAAAGLEAFGMSEAWSVLIRGCVVWLGLPDPAITREALRTQSSQELADLRDIVQAFAAYLKEANESATTTKNLCANLRTPGKESDFTPIRTVLTDALYLRPGQYPTPRRVSKLFSRCKGRIIDGQAIQLIDQSRKIALWGVEGVVRG